MIKRDFAKIREVIENYKAFWKSLTFENAYDYNFVFRHRRNKKIFIIRYMLKETVLNHNHKYWMTESGLELFAEYDYLGCYYKGHDRNHPDYHSGWAAYEKLWIVVSEKKSAWDGELIPPTYWQSKWMEMFSNIYSRNVRMNRLINRYLKQLIKNKENTKDPLVSVFPPREYH